MADEAFDAIVVGAGPAGLASAVTMARAGLNVAVLERGEYPGAKNVQGAVLYTKMLADVLPEFWTEPDAALERPVTEQQMWVLSGDAAFQAGFKSDRWRKAPHNAYTIVRVKFDRWFGAKAEAAGVNLLCGVTVKDVLRKDGRIAGIVTSEDDALEAHVVVACDGVNSMLAQKAGLIDEWRADEVALGVKETLALPSNVIEERFCLEPGDGTTIEMFGDVTAGMLGYAFLYTNKDTLSIGVGCKLSHFQKSGVKPYDLLERVKAHPLVRRRLAGAEALEYSAHLIPEGGFHSMPPLSTDGFLVAGDAAQMVNPAHREGSNLAMAAGRMAAEAVIEAHKTGDFSKKGLASYEEKLKASFVHADLFDVKDMETKAEENMELVRKGPALLTDSLHDFFGVDGEPRREALERIMKRFATAPELRAALKRETNWANAKAGLSAGWAFLKKLRGWRREG